MCNALRQCLKPARIVECGINVVYLARTHDDHQSRILPVYDRFNRLSGLNNKLKKFVGHCNLMSKLCGRHEHLLIGNIDVVDITHGHGWLS